MLKRIKKRDGRTVSFDQERITDAIFKAAQAVGGHDREIALELSNAVLDEIEKRFGKDGVPGVEEVQDIVEKVLIEKGHAKTAKAYILYRKQRADIRNIEALMNSFDLVEGYVKETDWRVRENSNMSYSLQGLNNHVSSAVISNYWVKKLYPQEIGDAHSGGDFHIHDLGVLGAYCVGWDLYDLLATGFGHVAGKIESSPPKHFRTALGQVVNFFYTLQGEAAGAQAFSNFDTLLAPYIRYDGLGYPEVKQAMQEFLFNMNVPTRVGFQTPFTNVTLDLTVPSHLAGMPAMVGGKPMEATYGDFVEEMQLFNEVFAEVMTEGDSRGRIFTFPIPTYNLTREFPWDSAVSQKIFEMTSKYGVPYFANFINSDMKPEDARSMCCRLRLDTRQLRKRGGGLFGANPLTGSIGVVTINLPRIGYLAKEEGAYFEKLGALMDYAQSSLEVKRRVLEGFTERGLYPYSKYYLRHIKESEGAYWKNHFATIGIVGMNESLLNFMGASIVEPEGKKFAIKVLDFMRAKLGEYQDKTGSIYNLEATPAEGTSFRLARIDKKKYPDIIVANDKAVRERGAAPFYTNSTHLPVDFTNDVFEALDLQDDLQTRYTGGTVLHGFLGERLYDWKVTRDLVRKVAENYSLPYFTITPTFSICPKHGYVAGEHEYCPLCDEEIGFEEAKVVATR
ncbi:Vitamin B12-dependent ribonucleoside-diphosphate reductase [Candidatus Norongarragalina meridionalis]|nr:Vitamin B12-dependent ribonucleoside-diphosphate reductase [Candidatus Norongarragalina meridionalis]